MIPARLQETLDDLDLISDRQERIDYLIALSQEFVNPGPEEVPRLPSTRVPGCESEVYLATKPCGAGLEFHFAVDNPQGVSAMALAFVLEKSLSGEPLANLANVSEDIVYRVFGRDLSMGKSMGLTGMVRMAKAAAEQPL